MSRNIIDGAPQADRIAVVTRRPRRAAMAIWGPGLLVMLADTDAGNIVTAAQAAMRWGYSLLPLPLLLIPMLFMVQDLSARLGLFTGRGFGALVRARFGAVWALMAGAALTVAAFASLVTEFDGIAGVGALYGVPQGLALLLSAGFLLVVVLSGTYRRVERVAIVIGLFELSFFGVAYCAHPKAVDIVQDIARQPVGSPAYLYMAAALIGATFNPWMLFYHPAALIRKELGPGGYGAARWDTAVGAVLTQLVTAAVLVATAATLGRAGMNATGLESVGQISGALIPLLGQAAAHGVFCAGVVGASMVAAIVCSLALTWGWAELAGAGPWRGVYVGCVVASAAVVWMMPDLVGLSIAAQAINAALLPVLLGLLVTLAATALPGGARLPGWYLGVVGVMCGLVAIAGAACALTGLS